MIDQTQIDQFRTEGYTTVPGFFEPREVRALRQEAYRWLEEGRPRDVTPNGEQLENLQLIPLFPFSPLYRHLPFHPKVRHAVAALIGGPVVKILDQMFIKPAKVGAGTNWHTDNAYFTLDNPMAGTAMWIALDDANRGNGTLKVIPGAFEQSLAHYSDPMSDHHIRTDVNEAGAVHCELAAGGVAFFCFGTPHATGDNPTSRPRAGVGLHFVNGERSAGIADSKWQHVALDDPQRGQLDAFANEVDSLLGDGGS